MPSEKFTTGSDKKVLSCYCTFVDAFRFFIGHFKSVLFSQKKCDEVGYYHWQISGYNVELNSVNTFNRPLQCKRSANVTNHNVLSVVCDKRILCNENRIFSLKLD